MNKLGVDNQAQYLVTVYSHIILSYNAIFKGYMSRLTTRKKLQKKPKASNILDPCLSFWKLNFSSCLLQNKIKKNGCRHNVTSLHSSNCFCSSLKTDQFSIFVLNMIKLFCNAIPWMYRIRAKLNILECCGTVCVTVVMNGLKTKAVTSMVMTKKNQAVLDDWNTELPRFSYSVLYFYVQTQLLAHLGFARLEKEYR